MLRQWIVRSGLLGISLILGVSPAWSTPDLDQNTATPTELIRLGDMTTDTLPAAIVPTLTPELAASHLAVDLVRSSAPEQPSIVLDDANDRLLGQELQLSQATASELPQLPSPGTNQLDLKPDIQQSPVLQRWLRQVPDVSLDIANDPSFRTRLRLGFSYVPSTDRTGWNVGIEDIFVGRSRLTISGDYQTTFHGERQAWGSDLRYYLRPLGRYINVAPVLGYRHLETSRYEAEGVNLGLRFLFAFSRTGAADIALTQSWVAPGSNEEVGLTTLSFGYALTRHLRLSTDFQKQNARQRKDSRVGIGLEWMF